MKNTTSQLTSYLSSFRSKRDTPLFIAELFKITLISGTVLTYCNVDVPITWNSYTYLSNSILISGLMYKGTIGVNVDSQQITISARNIDTIGGVPFLQAVQQGILDGAKIQRERVFLPSWDLPPIGSVIMFKGRVSNIESVGRTYATINVASDLILLDIEMPRNKYQPSCVHTLFDSGCSLSKATYSSIGTISSVSSRTTINWNLSDIKYQQGTVTFTSGQNIGLSRTINSSNNSSFSLAYPLNYIPSIGDSFTITQGCDHTLNTCTNKFNNLANFRGFPFVPPASTTSGFGA